MLSLERLKQIVDENFVPPFVKEGLVSAEFYDGDSLLDDAGERKVLRLTIGKRDVWLAEDGEVTSAGTFIG